MIYFYNLKTAMTSKSSLKNKGYEFLLEIGYQQFNLRYLREANIFFQFIFIYLFKLQVIEGNFNQTLKDATEAIMNVVLTPLFLVFCNILSLIPPILYASWMIIERISDKGDIQLKDSFFGANSLKKMGIRAYIGVEFIFIISETLNFRLFYLSFTDGDFPVNPLLLILGALSMFLVTSNLMIFPYSLLLYRWTFPILLCCLSIHQNVMLIRILAMLFLLVSLQQQSFLNSYLPFERSLKGMLLVLFILHIFIDSISMLYFGMINIAIVLLIFTIPRQEFVSDDVRTNEMILSALDKLRKDKVLNKKDEIKLMKVLLYYQSSVNDSQLFSLDINSDISYESLSTILREKLRRDMSQNKQRDAFKLQYFKYSILHQKLNLQILHQLETFSHSLQDSIKFKEKVQLLEIKHLIKTKFSKREEEMNLVNVMAVCWKLQQANVQLYSILEILGVFWDRLQNQSLTESSIYKLLTAVEKKEKQIQDIIQDLKPYPNAATQTLLYSYALKLFNFDYEAQELHPLKYFHKEMSSLAGCYYLILQENKIADISSEMLVVLRKKKSEVVGEQMSVIFPYQLLDFIEDSYCTIFKTENQPQKLILPFLDLDGKIIAFRVQLEVKYHIQSGLQYVIHFFKSEDIKDSPTFFYCADTDKIVHTCPLFRNFLDFYKRKLDSQMLACDLFNGNLSHEILSGQKKTNDTIVCSLLKQKNRQTSNEITLRINQIYGVSRYVYSIISIEGFDSPQLEYTHKKYSAKTFIARKMQQNRDDEIRDYKNEMSKKTEKEVTFCKISNSYQTIILEKMTKVKMNCRWSYLKLTGILVLLMLGVLIAGLADVRRELDHMKGSIADLMDTQSKESSEIQNTYFLFYQYYQFYQIKNYPQQILKIQNYDISSLISEYYKKANQNVMDLLTVPQNNLVRYEYEYLLEFPEHNETRTTSSTFILDFLADLKRALNSNDPSFSIANEHNINTYIDAYERISQDPISIHLHQFQMIILTVLSSFVFLFIVIKCVFIKIRTVSKQILGVYQLMDGRYARETLKKYKQLQMLVEYSGSNGHQRPQGDREQVITSAGELHGSQEEIKNQNMKIKTQSLGEILISSNYLIIVLLISSLFFLWINVTLNIYSTNITLVLQKNYNLHKTVVAIVRPAERYFEDAMQELLPPDKRRYYPTEIQQWISTSLYLDKLPDEFLEYMTLEREVLDYNLCDYSYLNKGALYNNINCSLILNGIMDRSLSETYSLYMDLVRNYSGTVSKISQLGDIFRPGATYPVFMEICYTRRTLNNLIRYLQDNMRVRSDSYVISQNARITNILLYSIILFPMILLIMMHQTRLICDQCKAIIKSFRLLPMDYLLNPKITKILRKQEILQKVEMMPF